jgi:hypothetical protein
LILTGRPMASQTMARPRPQKVVQHARTPGRQLQDAHFNTPKAPFCRQPIIQPTSAQKKETANQPNVGASPRPDKDQAMSKGSQEAMVERGVRGEDERGSKTTRK